MKNILGISLLAGTGRMGRRHRVRHVLPLAVRPNNVQRALIYSLLTALICLAGIVSFGGAAQARYAAGAPAQSDNKAESSRPVVSDGSVGAGNTGASPGQARGDESSNAGDGGTRLGPDAAVTLQVDDGTIEDSIGYISSQETYTAIWLNRFTAASCNFPIQLNQISIMFPDPEMAARDITGLAIDLLVYVDADANNDPSNATKLAQIPATITVADGATFSNYPVNVTVNTPGDIYVGFSDTYNSGGQSGQSLPSPLDGTTSQGRSWVVAKTTGQDPDYDNLANNNVLGTIDTFGFEGNWIFRASGNTAAEQESCSTQFTDVPSSGPGSTFYIYVLKLACRNIVSGYPCGGSGEPCDSGSNPYFRPGVNVSRGQISKMVALAAELSGPTGAQIFEDVAPGSPFYDPIQQLASRGYISGYPCGGPGEPCGGGNRPYFRPGLNTTRAQLSKIVSETAQFAEDPGAQVFSDVPTTSPFFQWINRLANRGAISGYPCGGAGEGCDAQNRPYFRPGEYVTRGQTSKIVANTFFPVCQPPSRP